MTSRFGKRRSRKRWQQESRRPFQTSELEFPLLAAVPPPPPVPPAPPAPPSEAMKSWIKPWPVGSVTSVAYGGMWELRIGAREALKEHAAVRITRHDTDSRNTGGRLCRLTHGGEVRTRGLHGIERVHLLPKLHADRTMQRGLIVMAEPTIRMQIAERCLVGFASR